MNTTSSAPCHKLGPILSVPSPRLMTVVRESKMPQVGAPVFFCVSEGLSPVSFALLIFNCALCSQQTVWTWMCSPPFFCVLVPSVINLFSSRRANGGVSGTFSDIVG